MSEASSPMADESLREKLVDFSKSYYDFNYEKDDFFEDACDEVLGTCDETEANEAEVASILDTSFGGGRNVLSNTTQANV